MLSLPQLVVCGDQSAGKSSVLEALTEIPFPRNDNLCTRFATEIILRRSPKDGITIKVIPDGDRPSSEKESIKAFRESIDDFSNLPDLMSKATKLMGLDDPSHNQARAFAKDVLSIEIEGPTRPQLTLVDLPGLIQTQTKGVTEEDVRLVAEITDSYIKQERTICLAMVSATNDYANQGILKRVREVDPNGERTLGIITKPDRLPPGSGSEKAYIELAKNKDIFFSLGWHVLKNRSFEEGDSSFRARNASEMAYFRTSNFSTLGKSSVGISNLRERLSTLLFNHVKKEIPKLRTDLEEAMKATSDNLKAKGTSRGTPSQCRAYLIEMSLEIHGICKAAVNGHYEGDYFTSKANRSIPSTQAVPIRRLRAIVQSLNSKFSRHLRTRGHKYHIMYPDTAEVSMEGLDLDGNADEDADEEGSMDSDTSKNEIASITVDDKHTFPTIFSRSEALRWVSQALARTRGKELPGNFNPLLIGELFWEQSEGWEMMTLDHVELVASRCHQFLRGLLLWKCSKDVADRLWTSRIEEALQERTEEAIKELAKMIEDTKSHPITYNHYYTDTLSKRRRARDAKSLKESFDAASSAHETLYNGTSLAAVVDTKKAAQNYAEKIERNMIKFSSQEALDCLFSIYKVIKLRPLIHSSFSSTQLSSTQNGLTRYSSPSRHSSTT
jgi:GTPase SAR1 family protein